MAIASKGADLVAGFAFIRGCGNFPYPSATFPRVMRSFAAAASTVRPETPAKLAIFSLVLPASLLAKVSPFSFDGLPTGVATIEAIARRIASISEGG